MKYLSILPYYAQDNYPHTRVLPKEKSIDYFIETYKSMKQFSDIVVGVQNDIDYKDLTSLELDFYIAKFDEHTVPPNHLWHEIVKYVQNKVDSDFSKYEFFFYNDADQIVYINIKDDIELIMRTDSNIYFSPQRLEQLPIDKIEARLIKYNSPAKQVVDYKGKFKENDNKYIFSNHLDIDEEMQLYEHNNKFYKCTTKDNAYGSAHLCHRELFVKVPYIFSSMQPGEHIAGHNLFDMENITCLKSVNNFDFYVDHLSGYHSNQQL